MDEYGKPKSSPAGKFLVVDLEGDYLKTLNTKHEVATFCVDEENNRLVMYLEDTEEPLAYLALEDVL